MPVYDAAAAAAVGEDVVRPAYFVFLDLLDDPIRATTAGYDVTFAEGQTGDPDLDGFTFSAVDASLVEIGDLDQSEEGSEPLVCTLSGIVEFDEELLATLADRPRWQGRVARFWRMERDEAGQPVGGLIHYHTGYMAVPEFEPSPTEPLVRLRVEGYLAAMTAQPSGRTYLSQADYDPADLSAAATIGAANGAKAGPGGSVGVGSGGSGGSPGGGGGSTLGLMERL